MTARSPTARTPDGEWIADTERPSGGYRDR